MDWRLKDYAPVAPLRSIAAMAIVLAGCVHSSSALHARRHISYWEALAELHPDDAVANARNQSEKEFAEALGNLMEGDIEKAEQRFGKLRTSATDSIIRSGSRVIYTQNAQQKEKWPTRAPPKTEPMPLNVDRSDKASIELWA